MWGRTAAKYRNRPGMLVSPAARLGLAGSQARGVGRLIMPNASANLEMERRSCWSEPYRARSVNPRTFGCVTDIGAGWEHPDRPALRGPQATLSSGRRRADRRIS